MVDKWYWLAEAFNEVNNQMLTDIHWQGNYYSADHPNDPGVSEYINDGEDEIYGYPNDQHSYPLFRYYVKAWLPLFQMWRNFYYMRLGKKLSTSEEKKMRMFEVKLRAHKLVLKVVYGGIGLGYPF